MNTTLKRAVLCQWCHSWVGVPTRAKPYHRDGGWTYSNVLLGRPNRHSHPMVRMCFSSWRGARSQTQFCSALCNKHADKKQQENWMSSTVFPLFVSSPGYTVSCFYDITQWGYPAHQVMAGLPVETHTCNECSGPKRVPLSWTEPHCWVRICSNRTSSSVFEYLLWRITDIIGCFDSKLMRFSFILTLKRH